MVFFPLRQCHAFRRAAIAHSSGGLRPPDVPSRSRSSAPPSGSGSSPRAVDAYSQERKTRRKETNGLGLKCPGRDRLLASSLHATPSVRRDGQRSSVPLVPSGSRSNNPPSRRALPGDALWRGRPVEGAPCGGGALWSDTPCGGGALWRGRPVEGAPCGAHATLIGPEPRSSARGHFLQDITMLLKVKYQRTKKYIQIQLGFTYLEFITAAAVPLAGERRGRGLRSLTPLHFYFVLDSINKPRVAGGALVPPPRRMLKRRNLAEWRDLAERRGLSARPASGARSGSIGHQSVNQLSGLLRRRPDERSGSRGPERRAAAPIEEGRGALRGGPRRPERRAVL
ncbi:hypothetical protein EYF80_051328 [Liparis tanakae]|uniref:Uncharacterized protein n=1 Tax=Liparis tanakae TaxID=230148 RepID=A0A4Z2FCK2_9TELE|nr:hypothetical protein EYF80_051328 [Liparis tanakae]